MTPIDTIDDMRAPHQTSLWHESLAGSRVIWCGQRGEDVLSFVPERALAGIVCCDWTYSLGRLSSRIPVVSVERTSQRRRLWSSATLRDISAKALDAVVLDRLQNDDAPLLLLPYMTTSELSQKASTYGERMRVLASPPEVVERLSDKVLQRQLFAKAGLPTPGSITCFAREAKEASCAFAGDEWPLVVQPPRSSLGIGTFAARRAEDMRRLATSAIDEQVLISRYLPGIAANIHAVASPRGTVLGWPSIMITGNPACCIAENEFAFCGNDFAASHHLSPDARRKLFYLAEQVGKLLVREGFIGLFGLDAILHAGDWHILEANCRFQGSTGLLASLEARTPRRPVVCDHIAALTGTFGKHTGIGSPSLPAPVAGSQIVLYQKESRPVVVPRVAEGPLESTPVWNLHGVAVEGTTAEPGSILGRLVSTESALDGSMVALRESAKYAVEAAYGLILGRQGVVPNACRHEERM